MVKVEITHPKLLKCMILDILLILNCNFLGINIFTYKKTSKYAFKCIYVYELLYMLFISGHMLIFPVRRSIIFFLLSDFIFCIYLPIKKKEQKNFSLKNLYEISKKQIYEFNVRTEENNS